MDTSPRTPRRRRTAPCGIVFVVILAALAPPAALAQDEGAPGPPIAWQRADVPVTAAGLGIWDVIAGGPGFIAVGGGFADGAEEASALFWVSEDGRTWQSVPLFGDAATGVPRAVASFAGGYVAVGSGCCPDEAAVWLSPDGLSWERLPAQPGFEATAMLAVAETPGGLAAVGCTAVFECDAGLAWTSTDGRTWAEATPVDLVPFGVTSTSAGALALGASQAYEGAPALAVSADGLAWPDAVVLPGSGSLEAALEQPYGLLAVGGTYDPETGDSDGLVATSPDGSEWDVLEAPRLRGAWLEDVASAGQGLLMAGWTVGRDGQVPATFWSPDLRTFRPGAFPRELKAGGMLHAAAFGPDGVGAVVAGSSFLNRGPVPGIWFAVEGAARG
jgi:hypothetical protein